MQGAQDPHSAAKRQVLAAAKVLGQLHSSLCPVAKDPSSPGREKAVKMLMLPNRREI